MNQPVRKFYAFLERPLFPWSRLLLALGALALVASFAAPLWRITLTAPQYPDGLWVDIYSYTLQGGNNGQHLQEINTINHYIGMHRIDRAALSDLDWMPFALGALVLLTLRVALIGNVRALVDLGAITLYVLGFAFVRFWYRLYSFGHNLSPDAPVHVKPFTPVVFGTRDIAQFTAQSYPRTGTIGVTVFALVVFGTVGWHLVAGRLRAERAERARKDDRTARANDAQPQGSATATAGVA